MSDQCRLNGSFSFSQLFGLNSSANSQNEASTKPKTLREQLGANNPARSECAYVGKRSLSWAPWVPGLSQNSILDSYNKELSHQHIFMGNPEENIGFGPNGIFAESKGSAGYRIDGECYNGEVMREAILKQDEPSYYAFLFSNCQTYIEGVVNMYRKLVGSNKSEG